MSSFCLTFCVFNYIQLFGSVFEPIHVSKYIICFKLNLLSKSENKLKYPYDVMIQNILGKSVKTSMVCEFSVCSLFLEA